jgi:hypothetical protein
LPQEHFRPVDYRGIHFIGFFGQFVRTLVFVAVLDSMHHLQKCEGDRFSEIPIARSSDPMKSASLVQNPFIDSSVKADSKTLKLSPPECFVSLEMITAVPHGHTPPFSRLRVRIQSGSAAIKSRRPYTFTPKRTLMLSCSPHAIIAQVPPADVAQAFDRHQQVSYFSTLRHAGLIDIALFLLLIAATVTFLVLCFRRFPFTGAFCSGLLFLALVPFIVCAVSTFLRLLGVISIEPVVGLWDGDWFGALRDAAAPFYVGLVVSIAAVCIYSILYVFSRRPRNAEP